jgi:ABC-type proline/glycine betaine transport system permease subunit
MTLSDGDLRFLERRRGRTHVGLYVLPVLLALLLGVWIGLFSWWPLAINPVHAAIHYEGLPIEKGTVTTYAIVAAVLLNALLFALAVAVTFGLLWARSERRYLRLLARLRASSAAVPSVEVLASKREQHVEAPKS